MMGRCRRLLGKVVSSERVETAGRLPICNGVDVFPPFLTIFLEAIEGITPANLVSQIRPDKQSPIIPLETHQVSPYSRACRGSNDGYWPIARRTLLSKNEFRKT
uniref:Uncharacterized protein n=1 Tax=Romanomermis culicivorax TaxID=13658 RepID=A0A915HHD2_ROMCU